MVLPPAEAAEHTRAPATIRKRWIFKRLSQTAQQLLRCSMLLRDLKISFFLFLSGIALGK
ncbi:hypothetical protein AO067_19300 [Pseudomonas viridiflava ICMP 13104]|uniref:Uncharacterized protein n=1 Tax=Pseudomonas viridiflava ICMP 13104 TaxID=1198305 RepID=A0A0W0I1L6_PSEVI|nr:hypothetical protein AO067_19300 [Pseudomonas viridiflava ICMP 13104]KTB85576.1 hypothetical protein AO070_13415 [Pseudomonas syringae pv. syringae PD2766]